MTSSKFGKCVSLSAALCVLLPSTAFGQHDSTAAAPTTEAAPAASSERALTNDSPSTSSSAVRLATTSAPDADRQMRGEKPEPTEPALVSVFRRAKAGEPASHGAQADDQNQANEDDGAMGSHQRHFYGMLGYRLTRVSDAGYEPFSERPAFHQASLSVGRVLFAREALSFALGLGWDYGASESSARGAKTELEAHRLTLLPEIRYHFLRRLYGFGRLGAGLGVVHAELSDAVIESTRSSDRLAFTVDGSVGAAYELIGEPAGASRRPRVWLLLDGGYVLTTQTKTALENESGIPARSQSLSFADLSLGGLSARVSAALTF